MYSNKQRVTQCLEQDDLIYIQKLAIEYGYKSITQFSSIFFKALSFKDDTLELDMTRVMPQLLEQKKIYYQNFDSVLSQYYSNDKEKTIIRTAHFYYTSKQDEALINEQLKNKSQTVTKYTNARNAIAELFIENELDTSDYSPILSFIDLSIEHLTKTRGENAKIFESKMQDELNKLNTSRYRVKEIISTFVKSL